MALANVTSTARATIRRAAEQSDALASAVQVGTRGGWTQTRVGSLDALEQLYGSVGRSLAAADAVGGASIAALRARVADAGDAVTALRQLNPGREQASSFVPSSPWRPQVMLREPRPEQALVERVVAAAPGRIAAELRRLAQ